MNEARPSSPLSRPAAVAAVAATYFYFLIFAEFALLELARPLTQGSRGILPSLAVLGGAGLAGSFAAAAWFRPARAHRLLAWCFRAAALGAVLAAVAASRPLLLAACAVTGFSLGGLTVALSASLLAATGAARLGLCVGLGTGLAYGACNVPAIFQAPAFWQAIAAGTVALAASFTPALLQRVGEPPPLAPDHRGRLETAWILVFVALVGLDSAAFYVIQHVPGLRAGSWGATIALWGNATMHLVAALVAGWAFDRGWRGRLVALALLLLVTACGTLSLPLSGELPHFFYVAGVSLYSVVLVAYPALGARPWLSARVFALAGWTGSALGIGLVLERTQIPASGIVSAVALLSAALFFRHRALRSSLALLALLAARPGSVRAAERDDEVARGREVYIAEGCLNCHSQYVRPQVAADVERWGPASRIEEPAPERPPLYGNRRQGPDLANVGLRRSPAWNRLHLLAPRKVSPGSVMPRYAHLFAEGDSRGPDLVAYLASLGSGRAAERTAFIAQWKPKVPAATVTAGARRLYRTLCAGCHGPAGRGDGALRTQLAPAPPDWTGGPRYHPPPGEDELTFLARTIKFGLPGSPMAGHEYLPDEDVLGLACFVQILQHDATGLSR